MRIKRLMIGIENLKPMLQPFLARHQQRKIVMILDMVMTVQMLHELLAHAR
jgi:hypothetical protein